MDPAVAHFLDQATDWVSSNPDIVALALVGSHARGAAGPDSDIDLVLLCVDPALRVESAGWAAGFGDVRAVARENYGAMRCLRVFYRDGLEVEFGFNQPAWAGLPLDAGTRRVIADGMRILYDPAGWLQAAQDAVAP